jgi:hypothetical protein
LSETLRLQPDQSILAIAPSPATTYIEDMPRIAKTKNGFAPKTCVACGLEFEWRKKWQRDWENVKYCSEKCKSK